jgi:hypothetical protein
VQLAVYDVVGCEMLLGPYVGFTMAQLGVTITVRSKVGIMKGGRGT